MDKNEAVCVLYDILLSLAGDSLNSIVLSESNGTNIAKGYRLEIKGEINDSSRQKIQEIAEAYGLLTTEDCGLVIFEPMANRNEA